MRSSRGFQGHGGHLLSSHPGESIRKTQNAPRWRKETPRKSTCISAEHSQRRPPAKIRIICIGTAIRAVFARTRLKHGRPPTEPTERSRVRAPARAPPTEADSYSMYFMQAQDIPKGGPEDVLTTCPGTFQQDVLQSFFRLFVMVKGI